MTDAQKTDTREETRHIRVLDDAANKGVLQM